MKIGIDARNLVTTMTGIGRYVLEMSLHLSMLGNEVILYLPERPRHILPSLPNATIRQSNFAGGLKRMFWGQTVLPFQAAHDKVDIFWGPAHRLPSCLHDRIARVVTIHDLVWRDMASTMRWQTWMADRCLMGPALTTADRIVADSTSTAREVSVYAPKSAHKVSVVYPGLTALALHKTPSTLERFGLSGSYILFVGTLEPRKNLTRLLKAYAALPETLRRETPLVLAGGQGWRVNDLNAQIATLGLAQNVHLTGYVTDEELGALYAGAHVLAMPSLYEGFGFPLIEAQAAGVPVLTSNSSSMPEVAGDAAVLVNPTDTRSIADGLMRLIVDSALHSQLSARASVNASRFDWRLSAIALVKVFEEAIAARRTR